MLIACEYVKGQDDSKMMGAIIYNFLNTYNLLSILQGLYALTIYSGIVAV